MSNKNSFFTGEVVKAAEIARKIPLNHKTKGLIPPDKKDVCIIQPKPRKRFHSFITELMRNFR